MKNLAVAAAILAIAALTWFEFPGHTWLQQDTQIYVPILEHLRDPAVLRRDILVSRQHVSYTLYDETARALAWLTGLDLRQVLEGEQFVTRAAGIWGLYLIGTALGLSTAGSLLMAAIVALGATIAGPAVLSFEIEPDPRGFAVPLLFLGIGFAAHGRHWAAGIAGAAAFLMHPPTVIPFWAVYSALAGARRRFSAFVPLAIAGCVLAVAAHFQQGAGEAQPLFARLTPAIEALQRLRAPYAWISMWWREWLLHYLILAGISFAAYARLRVTATIELRYFLVGLPLIGILTIPLSFLLLERLQWVLVPQLQPMRALLFVAVFAQIGAAAAGLLASAAGRYGESLAWFAVVYWLPINDNLTVWPAAKNWLAVLLFAGAASMAGWAEARLTRWRVPAFAAIGIAGFLALPYLAAGNPHLHTPELAQLSAWARSSTDADAVFLFADAGKQLQSGIFRSEALRAVYVDWKGGGQVNYLPELGEQWWERWQAVLGAPFDARNVPRYGALGIDYIVLSPRNRLPGIAPVFENGRYLAYRL
jgi:hypothetical protein